MRIWMITVGEPLPTDGTNDRLYRAGTLAKLLITKGHEVVWWTSTFDHMRKRQRFNTDTSLDINKRYRIKLLYSITYKKNVSVSRIINHYIIAHKFIKIAETEPQPDIILCSLPTLELSMAATKYGKKRGIPVVIDIRDLWPDIFLDLVPVWGQSFLRLILFPMFNTVRAACAGATAIVGITSAFVEWGIDYSKRTRSNLDKEFPMGYSEASPSKEAITEAEKFWEKYGIYKNNNEFIACFFGTIGRQFELETIINAARKIKTQKRSLRFVLCGSGDNLTLYKDLAKDCENVIFPGWVGLAQIWTLMRMSSVGLAPYKNIKNFTNNLPNKPIEYFSAGLPIVSSLNGVLRDLLSFYDCGLTYENNNSDHLISLLIDLYNRPERLAKMSENAFALYEEKFIAEKVYSDMNDYLELVCMKYPKRK